MAGVTVSLIILRASASYYIQHLRAADERPFQVLPVRICVSSNDYRLYF